MSVPGHPTDYYHVLQVCSTATDEEIRRAYKDLARVTHPDKNPNDHNATGAFQLLQEAYGTLSTPTKRAHYDALYRPSRHAGRRFRREEAGFDADYELDADDANYKRYRDYMRRAGGPRARQTASPSSDDTERRTRRERKKGRQMRENEKVWKRRMWEGEKGWMKAWGELVRAERVGGTRKKNRSIFGWLESVVDEDEQEASVPMEGDILINFEEEEDAVWTDAQEAQHDDFAKPGEQESGGNLDSQGREARKGMKSEWDKFLDRFESLNRM